ncbi:MAG: hypothetical protein IKO61_07485 [Lachnospiraceae bacterium]|nr:hypothetical protein [Lachnospiraceae bacterium]
MNRIKEIKGIIAIATAVFMLLSFAMPGVGSFGEIRVKAEVTYTVDMDIDELFKAENVGSTNAYFDITEDAVTIKNGTYNLVSTNSSLGYKLNKNLIMTGGKIVCKKYANDSAHNFQIVTNGFDVSISGGEIIPEDDKAYGVIYCTGSDGDSTGSDESIVSLSGTGKITGVYMDDSFDGTFVMSGGSIENDGGVCIRSNDETSKIVLTGGTITKTGINQSLPGNGKAIMVMGGTVEIGDGIGTKTVNISSSEIGVYVEKNTKLTIKKGAKITAANYAVENHFLETAENAVESPVITIDGGELKATSTSDRNFGYGIHHPGYGTLTINGGTIEGAGCGIDVENGKVDIKGGTIKSTNTGTTLTVEKKENVLVAMGAGISIAPRRYYTDIDVSISGGTIEGLGALYAYNRYKIKYVGASTGEPSTEGYGEYGVGYKIRLAITGGQFTATGTDSKAAEIVIDDDTKGLALKLEDATELTEVLESSITGGVFNTSEDDFAKTAEKSSVITPFSSGDPKSLYLYGDAADELLAAKKLIVSGATSLAKGDKVQITKGTVTLPAVSSAKWYSSTEAVVPAGAVEHKSGTALENTYTLKTDNPAVIKDTATLEVNKNIKLVDKVTGKPADSTLTFAFKTVLDGCTLSNTGITDTKVTNGVFNSKDKTGECIVTATVGATDEYTKKTAEITVSVTPHTHKGMTRTAGKAATCTEGGNETYYTCSDCGKKYSDENGTLEITDVNIAALGHQLTHVEAKEASCIAEGNKEYWSCSRCGKLFSDAEATKTTTLAATKIAKTKHATSYHGAKEATCTEDGNKAYWQCDTCKNYFTDKEATKPTTADAVVIPKLKHKMTAHEEIKATCTEDGQKAYWTCSVCRKTYTDAGGTKELNSSSELVIKSTGHKIKEEKEIAPTCTEAGKKAHFSCSECGKLFSDKDGKLEVSGASLVEKALGHDLTLHAAKAVSCTEDGSRTYWSCGTCNKLFLDIDGINETTLEDVTVKSEGHKLTGHEEIKGSCTEDGMKAYWDCSVCKKYFSDAAGKNEIAIAEVYLRAEGHKLTHIGAMEPGKTTYGNTEYWKCSVCGACFTDSLAKSEIDEEDTKIPPTEHILVKHDREEADCEREGHAEYWHCTDCGKYYSDAEAKNEIEDLESIKTPALGHVWGGWTITRAATKTKSGVKTRTCLRNSLHVQTVGIAPTGDEDFPELKAPKLSYKVYMQKKGWMKFVGNGEVAGIKGQALRLEAFRIKLENADGGIRYRAYVQKMGWQASKSNNMIAGTMGKSRRLEAVQIKLTGAVASEYNIYYRVYTQKYGWLAWTKNGGTAGTQGYGYRIEALQIKLIESGAESPVKTGDAYLKSSDEQEVYVISSIEDETGIPRTLSYNIYGMLAKDSYKDLCDVTYSYNSKGLISKAVVEIKSGEQETYKYSYDSSGRRTKVNFIGTTGTSRQMMYSYDSAGNLSGYSDRSYSCDSSGRIEKLKTYSISAWEEVSYDSYGNIKAIGTSSYGNKYVDSKLVQNLYGKYTYKKIRVRNDKIDLVRKQQWSLLNGDIDALFTVVIGWG